MAFNPGCSERCVIQRFSSSACQAVAGATQMPMTEVTSNARRNEQVGVLQMVYQIMPFLPLYYVISWFTCLG